MSTEAKLEKLKEILVGLDSVVVAYSGGVDSTLLLKVAYDCLGDKAIGVTAISASLPSAERAEAEALARQIGARYAVIESHETADPQYLDNTPNRCFFCKREVYSELAAFAGQHGFQTVIDGTNADDKGDHRPGRQAARQHGVRSPLLEAEMTKEDIRSLARRFDLSNWDKPSAACLSSRIPYGTVITIPMLTQVEHAELALKQLGLRQLRVRHHDTVARIEIELDDFPALLAQRAEIVSALQALGYTYITLDLAGFRSGSMNETLITGRQTPAAESYGY